MGEPKKIRKKYKTPRHPWQKDRLDDEKKLSKDYGFKNKREIWKVTSKLKRYKDRAKLLSAQSGAQAEIEAKQLVTKLRSLNLIGPEQELQDVLGVEAGVLADRRLQTMVYNRKLARSVNQARQMIVHKHIKVNNQTITSPSYLVTMGEESAISYSVNSPFANPDHPELLIDTEDSIAIRPEEKEELEIKKERDKKHPKAKSTKESKDNKKQTSKDSTSSAKEQHVTKKEQVSEESPSSAKEQPTAEKKETKKEEKESALKEENKKEVTTESKKEEVKKDAKPSEGDK